MRMLRLMNIESFKQRGRFSSIMLMTGVIFVNIWIFYLIKKYDEGWEMLIMQCSVINSFIMPVVISVYACRQMDFEHKGGTWKLLYTFAAPYEIFYAKIIRCSIQIFTAFFIQTAGIVITGRICGYPENIPAGQFVWLFLCNFIVCEILFLIHAMLSFFAENQAVSVCTGIAGGFAGFFLLYFPAGIIQRIIPWGLFGNTSAVYMDWNRETRVTKFSFTRLPLTDFATSVIWITALVILSCILLKRGNTDEKGTKYGYTKEKDLMCGHIDEKKGAKRRRGEQQGISLHHKMRLPIEFMKMRQLSPWLCLTILPCVSAFMGTFNYMNNKDVLTERWYSLWSQHTLFLNYLFMPVIIGVFASSIWHIEHTGTNWNQLLVNAGAAKIVLQKYLVTLFFGILVITWTAVLFILCGKFICGFTDMPPAVLIEWLFCGISGMACICAIQLLLSLIIRSFVIPVGISLAGTAAGLMIATKFNQPYILPYLLLAAGMRSNDPKYSLDYNLFFTSCVVQIILWVGLAIFYVNYSDVKTG